MCFFLAKHQKQLICLTCLKEDFALLTSCQVYLGNKFTVFLFHVNILLLSDLLLRFVVPFNTLRAGDADLRFNTVNLGTSASSLQCHSPRGNVSRGITPSTTTRVFGEYFLKISVHKSSQRICYKFLKKHSIKVD